MQNADITKTFIANKISTCAFQWYLPDEIRKLSVKQITKAESFDVMQHAVPGGLYDSHLGAMRDFEICATCNQRAIFCPGHFGHIELFYPLYNPILFDGLYDILKSICFSCNDWICDRFQIDEFFKNFKLLEEGDIYNALNNQSKLQKIKMEKSPFAEYLGDKIRYKNFKLNKQEIQNIKTYLIRKFFKLRSNRKCQQCKFNNPNLSKENLKLVIKSLSSEKFGINMELKTKNEYPKFLRKNKTRELLPSEIIPILKIFWQSNYQIMSEFWGFYKSEKYSTYDFKSEGYKIFFLTTLLVSSTKFRPLSILGELVVENEKSACLSRIISLNLSLEETVEKINEINENYNEKNDQNISEKNNKNGKRLKTSNKRQKSSKNKQNSLKNLKKRQKTSKKLEKDNKQSLKSIRSILMRLQSEVMSLFDSAVTSSEQAYGLKQFLEKKEGVLRTNFMGKRVNYSARSIVSPDMWIESTEIGVPIEFAVKLTFPEPVNQKNLTFLKKSIINGPKKHPGANFVETEMGDLIDLSRRSLEQRKILANSLKDGRDANSATFKRKNIPYNQSRKRVFRHIKDGDFVLMNRQPTLHKASMMGHRVKVLKNMDSVIRLHYTNCNTYNADFDGDEINLHLPQNIIAQAECKFITPTHKQYSSSKDSNPLRGLVQDHVCAALLMTKRDSFFTKEMYQQYVYITLSEFELSKAVSIAKVPPCIIKPVPLWSGKQILSTILLHVSRDDVKLNLNSKAQVSSFDFMKNYDDIFVSNVIIRKSIWLTGVCDKTQIGAKKFGLISAVNELLGSVASESLLTKLGKLFTTYLQNKGLTAGLSDLILVKKSEKKRSKLIKDAKKDAVDLGLKICGVNQANISPEEKKGYIRSKLNKANAEAELDSKLKTYLSKVTSEITKTAFPHGMSIPFPKNNFSLMVLSGGKGSSVNISQICALLGQQELEGKRVPRTIAGRTLPCCSPYDLEAESGGYISDRFLSGINPKVYFYHCMAGREGLCDTAIKTSRSGYLQRSIVKNLENLQIMYDMTVRELNGNIVQFNYGEDGINPSESAYLDNFEFIQMNLNGYLASDININDKLFKSLIKSSHISEKYTENLKNFDLSKNTEFKVKNSDFKRAVIQKYLSSIAHPGESVGIIAGQSIGEPSTQMTLNTFHLAGHGGANVTLGMPRLKEILMTGSRQIKTPMMDFGFKKSAEDNFKGSLAAKYAKKLSPIYFSELIRKVTCVDKYKNNFRNLNVTFDLIDNNTIKWEKLVKTIEKKFVPLLLNEFNKKIKISDMIRDADKEINYDQNEDLNENIISASEISEDELSGVNEFEFEGENSLIKKDIIHEKSEKSENSENSEKSEKSEIDEENGEKDILNEVEKEGERLNRADLNDTQSYSIKETPGIQFFDKISFKKNNKQIKIFLVLPLSVKKHIYILQLIKSLTKKFKLRETRGIKKCHIVENRVQTEGINLDALYNHQDVVDIHTLRCNDIHTMLSHYGVEASRTAIIEQIRAVFDVYGIDIDFRHLSLMADSMTWKSDYKAFNFRDLNDYESEFLKISFESGIKILQQACLFGKEDDIKTHSAKLVMGQLVQAGTGCFDLLQKIL